MVSKPIKRISYADEDRCLRPLVEAQEPVIVSGVIDRWPAAGKWSPSFFAREFGDLEFQPSINLPLTDCPYDYKWKDFQGRMTMSEFVERIDPDGPPCYVRRQTIDKFPSAENDVRFESLHEDQPTDSNSFVWFGCNTLTGLHFDLSDGILCQFYGVKRLYLIAPEYSKFLYPYRDSVTKSEVVPEAPDLKRFPGFRNATVLTGKIEPGEFVFLPRRWWHSIRAEGTSISASHDFGQKVTAKDIATMLNAGGVGHWMKAGTDFVWHGLMQRPYSRRLFDDPPFGVHLYEMLSSAIVRRTRANKLS